MSVLKEYFTFSKKDRAGIIALLIVLMISIGSFIVISNLPVNNPPTDFSAFKSKIDKFESQRFNASNTESFNDNGKPRFNSASSRYFNFDPNTISVDSLKLLGVYGNIAQRITKYRNAGGKFKKPEDILKIYGFSNKLYNRLSPYIKIAAVSDVKEELRTIPEVKSKPLVNLNAADTTELKSLKGIGSKLSARIVKFRTNAGGFYSIDQLSDIYGLKPELIEELKGLVQVDNSFQRININSATVEQLKAHPYINKWNVANAIVNYRAKHGSYKQATDLMKTDLVSEELCRKIAPYLIFE